MNKLISFFDSNCEDITAIHDLKFTALFDEKERHYSSLGEAIKRYKNLQRIDLLYDAETDGSVEVLIECLKNCKNLEIIHLHIKNVDDFRVEHLVKSLQKKSWKNLPTLCDYMAKGKRLGLQDLYLDKNYISKDFLCSNILPHLPNTCEVHYKEERTYYSFSEKEKKEYKGRIDYSSLGKVNDAILMSAFILPPLTSVVCVYSFLIFLIVQFLKN
ncbi:hypothetical protein [Wolbachia endosymbiont of Pentidionis agamae]|uniref:hypothetical protein n=1 Tax=Wolbachia endosymbiont of Pentidionis agamae TaxID=3110435 RepID=UPI002FD177F1